MRMLKLLLLVLSLGAQGVSRAEEPNHSGVKVTAIRERGKVVGARISLLLKTPEQRFTRAKIGLIDKSNVSKLRGSGQYHDLPELFHLQFEPVPVAVNTPLEKTLELRYGKGNQLTGGEKVTIVSRWPTAENAELQHLWGDSSPVEFDLPK